MEKAMELCRTEAKIMHVAVWFESNPYVPQRLLPELVHCERDKLICKQNGVQLILFRKLRFDPYYFTSSMSWLRPSEVCGDPILQGALVVEGGNFSSQSQLSSWEQGNIYSIKRKWKFSKQIKSHCHSSLFLCSFSHRRTSVPALSFSLDFSAQSISLSPGFSNCS